VDNGRYKADGTLRKRTEFGQFSHDISAWIHQVSINDAGFPTEKTPSVSTWQLAYGALDTSFVFDVREDIVGNIARQTDSACYLQSNIRWLILSHNLICGLTSPTIESKIREVMHAAAQFIKVKDNPSMATVFHVLINLVFIFCMLEPYGDARRGNFILYSCTCIEYFKRGACHHSLAKGIKDGVVHIPVDRSFQILGKKKRGRERIARVAGALCHQPSDPIHARAGCGFASSQTEYSCCFLCGETNNSKCNKIVFCDGCDMGYHQKCMGPKIINIPE
jgi:hypothetical protein